ncbi:MAG: glycogen/starch/alpha-glucan phosphorylase, partial [Clostridia bacterium]|nr:glycogen/starch/alpha-glucan phosphorylase [Clostridia bacterium]
MQNKKIDILSMLNDTSTRLFSCNINESTEKQLYKTVCTVLRELLAKKRKDFKKDFTSNEQKQVYYMSMEFLVGTSLRNNLCNIGLEEEFRAVLEQEGFNLDSLYELDPDAGLGNGGLGRLASCYMDSATGLGLPVTGFSIRYEFGIFKQKIIDGW